MFRTSAIFIGACIAIIAVSLSVILYVHAGFSPGEAAATGLGLTVLMSVLHINAGNARERAATRHELNQLYEANDELERALDTLRGQVTGLEALPGDLEEMGRMIEAQAVVTMEQRVEELIVKQVASARDVLLGEIQPIEDKVQELAQEIAAASRRRPAEQRAGVRAAAVPEPGSPLAHLDDEVLLEKVRKAVEDNRAEVYFQPVVTLPQRKVRYYEAFTRLRADDGELIMPADFLRVAEPASIMPLIDNLLLFRIVQVVRRLSERNRAVGVFCNISTQSLVDPDFFPQFMDFLEHNKVLASSIFFEFPQAAINAAGPIEMESLAALHEQGFRFSMDQVTNLDINAQQLGKRGFKFVRVEAQRLLDGEGSSGAQIHPADLSRLLQRYGIELIAEKIEQENTLLNLLDFEVPLGQGNLFAEPKPVRGNFGDELPQMQPVRKAG